MHFSVNCRVRRRKGNSLDRSSDTAGTQVRNSSRGICCRARTGPRKSRVWVVEHGGKLYVEGKDANGDLTDDGPPTSNEKGFPRNARPKSWRYDYALDRIQPLVGVGSAKGLSVATSGTWPKTGWRLWRTGRRDDGLSLKLDGRLCMPVLRLLWSDSSENASIIHFGGLMLRTCDSKNSRSARKGNSVSFGFMNPVNKGA